jgi:farnesyl diphosphate synthase
MAVVTDNLAQGLKRIQADIDALFDLLLPVPEDRARA